MYKHPQKNMEVISCSQCSVTVSMAAGGVVGLELNKHVNRTCVCRCRFLPLGVLAVNSGSKQNVSSGLPAAGLNGGWSSLLYSFCRKCRRHICVRNWILPQGCLERVNICESEAKTPPRLTPFPIRLQLGPANSILLALKHSRRAISAHTVRTGPLPRHTQTWMVWPRLMASSHQANRLLGVNPQQKLESYMRVCEKWEGCVCVRVRSHSSRWWKRKRVVWSPPLHRARPLKTQITRVQLTWHIGFLLFSQDQHVHTFLSQWFSACDLSGCQNVNKLKISEWRNVKINTPHFILFLQVTQTRTQSALMYHTQSVSRVTFKQHSQQTLGFQTQELRHSQLRSGGVEKIRETQVNKEKNQLKQKLSHFFPNHV